MDCADGTNTSLVGTVNGHIKLSVKQTGRYKLSGINGEGFIRSRRGGTGIAHTGTCHASQNKRKGPEHDARAFQLGRAGYLTPKAGSIEYVLNDALHLTRAAKLFNLLHEFLSCEVIAGILDGTDQGMRGVNADPSGLGFLMSVLELSFVHLDGIFGVNIVIRGVGRVGGTTGTVFTAICRIARGRRSHRGRFAKYLGNGMTIADGLDGKVELTAVTVGMGQVKDAVDAVAGRGTLLTSFERNVLADAGFAQPFAGWEGIWIVAVGVGLGCHPGSRNSFKGEDDFRSRMARSRLAEQYDRITRQDVLDARNTSLRQNRSQCL
mmetsp:Transcript_34475/g.75796  ORF Transcript_34475/g.75796 Transcript_34475/m.75796 type:complete len:322 (+) Transcript_34475:1974-2939(+)